jgi:hypothetical protein
MAALLLLRLRTRKATFLCFKAAYVPPSTPVAPSWIASIPTIALIPFPFPEEKFSENPQPSKSLRPIPTTNLIKNGTG